MRRMMGLHKDRHGTYYARHKVPLRLQGAVARVLENGKSKQVWLKRSLGTKVLSEANVRGKPVWNLTGSSRKLRNSLRSAPFTPA